MSAAYFQKMFGEAGALVIEYQGKSVYRCLKFTKPGHYSFTVRGAVSGSAYLQSLVFHIGYLNGTISVNQQPYEIPKTRFPQLILPAEELVTEVQIDILLTDGCFTMCNGSDPLGTGAVCHTLTMGSALMMTALENGWYRICCNDFEYDDDFDDFVFEVKPERDGAALDIGAACEITIK